VSAKAHCTAGPQLRLVFLGPLVGALAFLLGLSPTVSRAAFPDANCPGPPNAASVVNFAGERRAQPFTVQRTGNLVQGQAAVSKSGFSGDWAVQVLATDASGVPTNTVLASATIADAAVPMGDSTLIGTFSPPASVSAGQQYALTVSRSAQWLLQRRADDPSCPSREYFSPSQTDPFIPSGTPSDMIFATFVDPPNDFSIGKLKGRKLRLTVPGAGGIEVRDARAAGTTEATTAAAKKRLLQGSNATASGPGSVAVALHLAKAAKLRLQQKGKVNVRAGITFTPTNGTPNRKLATLKIRR
jgi:hypothetical protein